MEVRAHQISQDSYEDDGSSHENIMFSDGSSVSLSSSDAIDDTSSSNSSGSLYDLSELMVELPIKRGLSKFYQGRSESFTSLSRVTSVEDLAKKASPCRRKMKSSKSCRNSPYILPKPIISKAKKLDTNKRGSYICSSSRPSMAAALQKIMEF